MEVVDDTVPATAETGLCVLVAVATFWASAWVPVEAGWLGTAVAVAAVADVAAATAWVAEVVAVVAAAAADVTADATGAELALADPEPELVGPALAPVVVVPGLVVAEASAGEPEGAGVLSEVAGSAEGVGCAGAETACETPEATDVTAAEPVVAAEGVPEPLLPVPDPVDAASEVAPVPVLEVPAAPVPEVPPVPVPAVALLPLPAGTLAPVLVASAGEPVVATVTAEVAGDAAEVTAEAAEVAVEAAEVTGDVADATGEVPEVGGDEPGLADEVGACACAGGIGGEVKSAAFACRENIRKTKKSPAATMATCTARRAMRRNIIGCGMSSSTHRKRTWPVYPRSAP